MKLSLTFLVILTLVASAGFADGNQPAQSGWSWESFKAAVSNKIQSIVDSFQETPKYKIVKMPKPQQAEQNQAQPEPQPQPQAPAPVPVAVQAPPKAPAPRTQASAPVAQPVSQSWFSYILSKVTGTQVQTQTQTQNTGEVAEPVPQVSQVQTSQPVAVKEPSMFDRLKNWVVGFTTSTKTSDDQVEAFPQGVKIQEAAPQVNAIIAGRVATPAVPYNDKNLIMGHNNIPVFRFKSLENKLKKQEVKNIPLLNVGQEEILDRTAFKLVTIVPYPLVKNKSIPALEAPEVASNSQFNKMLGEEIAQVKPPEQIVIPVLEAAKKVTGEKIEKLVYTLKPDIPYSALPLVAFNEEDLKLLRGLILYEKKDQCHIATGIFADLLDSQRGEVNDSARFHLGVCLHEMNLPTEALRYLTKTAHSKNAQFAQDSIKAMVEDVQLQNESLVAEALLNVDSANYPRAQTPQINYLKGKYFLRKNQPNKAIEMVTLVPPGTPPFYKAQYVAAIAEYEMGKVEASMSRQKDIANELVKNGKDKNLLTLFEMNLGRISFQKAKYKDALEAYQKVPKETSFWIQSLIEEGWVQLQSKDMAGAIGNMHSIESPYFSGVYKPESYVLRSIGYLDICQYPDAFKSIAYLEHYYQPWLERLTKYNGEHTSSQTYETILKQLQGKSNLDMDGLPYQIIREAARQRDFLNAQEAINQLIDENTGYPFVRTLIEKDRKTLLSRRNATVSKVAQLKDKIRRASNIPDGMKNFNSWRFELASLEDFLMVYEFKVKTLKEGLDGLNRLAPKAQERIAENKDKMKTEAGRILRQHLMTIAKDLKQNLDNDELLKYEVYAGSGENLRYKIAGGKTGGSANMSKREPAGQHWDFDGEFWEDEIGNYRSSLKNNCQNQNNMAGGPSGAQKGDKKP